MSVSQRLRCASAKPWRGFVESLEPRTLLTGLTGQYFDRLDFTNLKLTRTDATVDFNWPNAPDAAVGADFFSARWRGQVEAPAADAYTFYVTSDDGVRLWVDGRLLIDNWANQGATERSAAVALDAGRRYDVRLDYYEYDLGAQVQLSWSSGAIAKQIVPSSQLFPSPTGLTGTYYDNADFTNQVVTRNDAGVNFNWGTGSPAAGVGADTFSARWTGQVVPQFNQTYTFYASGDSLARLRVDGQLLVDNASLQDGAEIELEAGKYYDIEFEYAEDTGAAAIARLEWSSPSLVRHVIPAARLTASVATAIPSRRADYTNAVLNNDRPDPGVIFADGSYWMVHTTGGPNNGWPLYRSTDLTSWTFVRDLLTTANKPAFMTDAFWAPEIHKIGNQFVLTGTSWSNQYNRLVIALATSPEIGGPYTVQTTPIVADSRHVLDSHIFQDHDGRVYFLWKRDGPTNGTFGTIQIREMNATATAFAPGSVETTILDNSVGGWERNLAEAPWVIRRGGFYYLFYSAGFIDTTYSVGVARATSPLGPFTRSAANPIITHNATFAGPGHGGFTVDRDGVVWHLYHTRRAANPDFGRVQVLDRVVWGADGWPRFGNGGTPSTTLQPGPVVDAASGAGLITVSAPTGTIDDVIRLARGAGNAAMLDVFVNGTLSRSVPFAEIERLTIDGRGGNDTLLLDYSRGEAIPGAGVTFTGGAGAADTVRLVGASPDDAFRFANGVFTHGSGVLTFTGAERFLLENGTFRFDADAGVATTVEAATGGVAMFNVSQRLAALRLTGTGRATLAPGGGATLVTDLLTIVGTASTLDVNDNAVVVRSAGLGAAGQSAARQAALHLRRGLENGGNFDWLGAGISSTAAAVANGLAGSVLYGVGVIQNNLAAAGSPDGTTPDATAGSQIYTTFAGVAVGLNDVLIRRTYMGDADLDGEVTGTDYSLLDAGFGAGLSGWINGDFDYSGNIDSTDYALIDNAFGAQTGPLGFASSATQEDDRERAVDAVVR